MSAEPRLVEVRKNVLKQNDLLARELRERFRQADVFVASFVSSPGSGKTAFLEKTLTRLRPNFRCAALVGDLATANDAELKPCVRGCKCLKFHQKQAREWRNGWYFCNHDLPYFLLSSGFGTNLNLCLTL